MWFHASRPPIPPPCAAPYARIPPRISFHMKHSRHALRGSAGARRCAVFALLLGATGSLLPADAAAQGIRSSSRSAILQYARADAQQNGYEDAGLWFDYHFAPCVGESIQVMTQLNLVHFQAGPEYWYQGRRYVLPPEISGAWREVAPGQLDFTASLSTPGGMRDERFTAFRPSASRCNGWKHAGVRQADLWDKDATPQQKIDALARLSVGNGRTAKPLRNPRVEQYLAQQISTARRDSIARATARRDSVQRAAARRDSVQRAAAEQARRRATGAGANGATPAAGPTASAAPRGGSPGRATGGGATPEQQRADSVARVQAERQQAYENAMRQLEAQRAANEARDAQIEQAAQQIGDMVGAVLRDRQEQAERRAARAAAAAAAKSRAQLRARAAYFQAAEQPRCTTADARRGVTVGATTRGSLTLEQCRRADSASAVIYTMDVTRKEPIVVRLSSQFYGRLVLERDDSVVARTTTDFELLDAQVTPGRYRLTVTSDALGETGSYTLAVERGTQSQVRGLIIGMVAGGGSFASDLGPSAPAAGAFVVGGGIGNFAALLFQLGQGGAVEDGSTHMEGGLRVYALNRHSRWRPWAQYFYGQREYCIQYGGGFSDWGCFSGQGGNIGAGASWFVTPQIESEVGVQRATTSLDFDGTPTDVTETRLLFGFSFHWYRGPR